MISLIEMLDYSLTFFAGCRCVFKYVLSLLNVAKYSLMTLFRGKVNEQHNLNEKNYVWKCNLRPQIVRLVFVAFVNK